MPELEKAIAEHRLGYEAARLVSEIATPETVGAWVARAEARTLKLLREEIDGMGMLGRLGKDEAPVPPSDALMHSLEVLESHVVSGAAFLVEPGESSKAVKRVLDTWHAGQKSGGPSTGRVTLRFWVQAETYRFYRWLERVHRRYRPTKACFFHYLCESLIETTRAASRRRAKRVAGPEGRRARSA